MRNIPRPREEWIAVSVPAIIDQETFAAGRAQAERNEQYSPRNRRHEYVFSQMMRCDECHSAYCGAKATQGRPRYVCRGTQREWERPARAQRERGTQRDPVKVCTMPDFYEPDLLGVIWTWFSNLLKNPDDVIAALNERNASQDAVLQPLRDRLARLERKIAETQQRIVNLRDRLETESDAEERDDLKARLSRAKGARTEEEQARAETAARLEQQSYSLGQLDDIHTICRRWEGKLDGATPAQQRELLGLFRFTARLAVESGNKVAHVTCELGSESLLIGNTTLTRSAA